jgi:hypothetical protein
VHDIRVESAHPRGYAWLQQSKYYAEKSLMQQRILLRSLALMGLAGAFVALPLRAQDTQTDSVAEAARRARAQKKSAAKPATVITDDTLKPAPATQASNDNAAPAASPDAAAAPASADAQTPAAQSTEEQEKKKAEIEALKQQVAAKQAELDLAQRQLTLDNDAYYGKPNYQDDRAGASKISAEQADVNQKKDELAALKAKLDATGYVAPATPPPAPVGPTTLGPPRP